MTTSGAHRANRRISARVACLLSMSYASGKDWHPATGMDLSVAGCRIRLGEDLPRGSKIKVRIDHPSPEGKMNRAEVVGNVIWSRLEGLSFQAGIQFDSDQDPDLHNILMTLG